MQPSLPFVYKPSESTLHRDLTPAQNIPRYDPLPSPLSSLFALTLSLHESSRLCGKKHPHPLFTSLIIPSSSTSKALFSHLTPQWQHICAASLAVANPPHLRTEK